MSAPTMQQNPGRPATMMPKKTKLMAVMELAKPLFPNLTDIQIIEYVDRVKKKFGTLKGKTNDEIIQEMCKFMQAEGKKKIKILFQEWEKWCKCALYIKII